MTRIADLIVEDMQPKKTCGVCSRRRARPFDTLCSVCRGAETRRKNSDRKLNEKVAARRAIQDEAEPIADRASKWLNDHVYGHREFDRRVWHDSRTPGRLSINAVDLKIILERLEEL